MGKRDPLVQAAYEQFRRESDGGCSFCALVANPTDQVVATYRYMLRIKNRFPYVTWDTPPVAVVEHLMIIPKRHVLHLDDFTNDERDEYFQLLTWPRKTATRSTTARNTIRCAPWSTSILTCSASPISLLQ